MYFFIINNLIVHQSNIKLILLHVYIKHYKIEDMLKLSKMIGILSGVKKMDSIKYIKKDYNQDKKLIILELIINCVKRTI
jgi:hypothetical protein